MSRGGFLFHIGYPKSASSTLQQAVLARHEDVNYLSGRPLKERLGEEAKSAFDLYARLRGRLPGDREALLSTWRRCYLPLADRDRVNVLSTEYLIQNRRPVREVAEDLHALAPDADILIVVRDQAELLRSLYDMNPFYENDPKRAFMPFDRWLGRMLEEAETNFASRLRYAEVAQTYADVFGAKKVHVVGFGKLTGEPAALAPFCMAVDLDPDRFAALLEGAHLGGASRHGYRKLTRRMLGGRSAAALLPPAARGAARRLMQRGVPSRRTKLNRLQLERIRVFYAGHAVEDLRRLPLGSTIA